MKEKNQVKYITELDATEALDFLMESEQYKNFELPEYFDFDSVLDHVKEQIGEKPYAECIIGSGPKSLKDVNFDIVLNKDGKYAVRPLVLSNPYLYYFLAREICLGSGNHEKNNGISNKDNEKSSKNNWDKVKDTFKKCRVPNINVCAIPVVPQGTEEFHKSTTILNWWNNLEQRSIELSLEYRYMFVSDITNCYGSINPQAIDWALSCKDTSLSTEDNHEFAHNIQQLLQDLQNGRNIGIPQGSTLFDIIAEIILCYADLLLHEKLLDKGISEGYKILRYRDDYRIFCNNHNDLETISYSLQEVLEALNFRMNSSKTHISNSIITDSIKPDKLFYIFNTPIFNKKGCDFDGIQKHLLYIMMFGRKYPNSGQLRTMLSDLDKRIKEKIKASHSKRKAIMTLGTELLQSLNNNKTTKEGKEEGASKVALKEEGTSKVALKEKEIHKGLYENIRAMSAIATQIAIENMSITHYALRIISRMTDSMNDEVEKEDIIEKVCNKLINQPNSTYSKLWLQNMTYKQDVTSGNNNRYNIRLCQMVMGEDTVLWNNSWLIKEISNDFPESSVVNRETLAKITPIITFKETRAAYTDFINENNIEKDIEDNIEDNLVDIEDMDALFNELEGNLDM